MVEVGKCRLEPDKDKRVAQILATDVTREQLAEDVWSMERIHATQHDLIMELMDRNAKLREISADMLKCIKKTKVSKAFCWKCPHHRDIDELRSACFLADDARKLGIEVE
jgi:hypothetical protein